MSTIAKNYYPIVIIGAGPAGLNAARVLCEKGMASSTLLLDKLATWEKPIACAEAVGKRGFHESIDVLPEWIRYQINGASFFAPNNECIDYTDSNKGYIINRARMQQDLYQAAAMAGIECHNDIRVTSISKPENGKRTIVCAHGQHITASVIIDASGPLSNFGSTENLNTKCLDLEPAFFAVVENVSIKTDRVYVYMDSRLAPGGYAWAFPREDTVANIGIVLGKNFVTNANIRGWLTEFIQARFPQGKVQSTFGGSIPCGVKRQPLAIPGLIKAGDSASTVNPISRAGIVEALLCGKLAAQSALQMLSQTAPKAQSTICKDYEKRWHAQRGKQHFHLAKAKNSLARVPDSDFDKAVHTLGAIPLKKLTMSTIFKVSVGRFPRLVWALRHLMV